MPDHRRSVCDLSHNNPFGCKHDSNSPFCQRRVAGCAGDDCTAPFPWAAPATSDLVTAPVNVTKYRRNCCSFSDDRQLAVMRPDDDRFDIVDASYGAWDNTGHRIGRSIVQHSIAIELRSSDLAKCSLIFPILPDRRSGRMLWLCPLLSKFWKTLLIISIKLISIRFQTRFMISYRFSKIGLSRTRFQL